MKCKWCDSESYIKQGRIWLCKKHYRFQQMRSTAKRYKKSVPLYEELEKLYLNLNGKCPSCLRQINLLSKEGRSTVITLQHDRNGDRKLICLSCNTRHASFSGDTFYNASKTEKTCPGCAKLLPYTDFYTDNDRRWKSKKTYCKACSDKYAIEWKIKNKERFDAKRREYYHARIAAGNPIPRARKK